MHLDITLFFQFFFADAPMVVLGGLDFVVSMDDKFSPEHTVYTRGDILRLINLAFTKKHSHFIEDF